MNVVVLADFAFVNGGAGRIALESAKGLASRGHHVTLFTGVGPVADDLAGTSGLTSICLDQPDVWHDPSKVRAALRGIWNPASARRLAEVLEFLDPHDTVLHLHSWSKALSSSVVRVADRRGFRVVTTLHDFLGVCPTGTLFNHQAGQCCPLKPMSLACVATDCDANSYPQKLWRVARHAVQGTMGRLPSRGGDYIVVSEASAQLLAPLLPSGAQMHHVANFTDVPYSEPAPVERNHSFVYVGRLSAEKGPLLLAECLERLHLDGVFVGDGELSADIRARCPRAELAGWLSSDRVHERIRQARTLVFPSLWPETQGLVVAEAAALGVPAIVPDMSAARDWVVNGTTGLWFAGGRASDLSAALKRVMEEPGLAAHMGREAHRRFWASPPTLDRHLQELERVYSLVLERTGARRWSSARTRAVERTC